MISVNQLKRLIQGITRVGGSEEFDLFFNSAINSVINDLKMRTILDIDFIDEDNPPETIDLDAAYRAVFIEGIYYFMAKNVKWARRDEKVSDAFYRRELDEAQTYALKRGNVHSGRIRDTSEDEPFIPTYQDNEF